MLAQLLVGAAVSLVNIAIHAVWTVHLGHVVRRIWARRTHRNVLLDRVLLMVAAVAVLMTAHTVEMFVWAATYAAVGAAPAGASYTYFAFVNYTTLGYGDVLPVARWQLLGPITAMNGILLFGWSVAAIIEVLNAMARQPKESESD